MIHTRRERCSEVGFVALVGVLVTLVLVKVGTDFLFFARGVFMFTKVS